jgi:hypothetical protein
VLWSPQPPRAAPERSAALRAPTAADHSLRAHRNDDGPHGRQRRQPASGLLLRSCGFAGRSWAGAGGRPQDPSAKGEGDLVGSHAPASPFADLDAPRQLGSPSGSIPGHRRRRDYPSGAQGEVVLKCAERERPLVRVRRIDIGQILCSWHDASHWNGPARAPHALRLLAGELPVYPEGWVSFLPLRASGAERRIAKEREASHAA